MFDNNVVFQEFYNKVKEFQVFIGQEIDKESISDQEFVTEHKWLHSEVVEFWDAIQAYHQSKNKFFFIDVADGLVDVVYIALGIMVKYKPMRNIQISPDPLFSTAPHIISSKDIKDHYLFYACNSMTLNMASMAISTAINLWCKYFDAEYFKKAFDEVHETNMNKVIWDENIAKRTVDDYTAKGDSRYLYKDGEKDGKKYYLVYQEDGKLKKPLDWKEPNLKFVIDGLLNNLE